MQDQKYGLKITIAFLALIAVIVSLAFLIELVFDRPSNDFIKDDIAKAEIPWSDAGAYGSQDSFTISFIDIVEMKRTPVPKYVKELIGSDWGDYYYSVKATVKASNGSVDCETTFRREYRKYEGKWGAILGSEVDDYYVESLTSTAIKGISETAIKNNASVIITNLKTDGSNDHIKSFIGADIHIDSLEFNKDAQSCRAKLTYTTSTDHSEGKLTITADFAYKDNTWTLQGAEIVDDANTVS